MGTYIMAIDYSVLFDSTLRGLGFDLVPVYNCFDMGYDIKSGWPLKLPDVEFGPRTLLLLHFQDFVTPGSSILELERVQTRYQDRSRQVLVTYWSHGMEQHYQGPINLIKFSNHNLTTVQSLAARESEWSDACHGPRDIDWICLNGRMCLHRRRAVDWLLPYNNGIISYGMEIALERWPYNTYCGAGPGLGNDDNFIRLLPLFSRSKINIVTETQYDARPGIITEKTLHAFVAGQIPLVIGHPGCVQDTEDMGFDMFRDIVDTTYDHLPNHDRVESALNRNRDIILGRVDFESLYHRIESNRQQALVRLPQIMIDQFQQAARSLADRLLS